MKAHSQKYKEEVKIFGRQIDSKITYTLNGENIELGGEELNSITPHFKTDILKSAMKQLDIDSNVLIPVGTVLNYKFGVLVDEQYEYINYGNYVVRTVEKQEDLDSYKITCYDKMLYAMVDYRKMNITFPITVRDYINAICNEIGITFADNQPGFANYDKLIPAELYLDTEGNSLGYTFRDVLDELAEVTASIICINENDELEIRYPIENENYENISGEELNITVDKKTNVRKLNVYGNSEQDGTATPDNPVEIKNVGVKNLLNLPNGTYTNNGITAIVEDGKIILNGTAASTSFIRIPINVKLKNQNYTLGVNNEETVGGTSTSVAYSCLRFRSGTTDYASNSQIAYFGIKNSYKAYNWNTNITELTIRTNKDLTYDNFVIYPQLEEGNIKHDYVPYGNWLVLNHNNKIIKTSLNKENLFDINSDYNTVASCGGDTGRDYPAGIGENRRTYFFEVKPNTTYTISTSTSFEKLSIYYNNSIINPLDYTFAKRVTFDKLYTKQDGKSLYSFTTENDTKMVAIYYALNTIAENIQLYEGFLPYYELNKIGDVQDEIDATTGVLTRRIGKIVLDGSETIKGNGSTATYGEYYITLNDKKYGITNIMSDYFMIPNDDNINNRISGRASNRNIYFRVGLDKFSYSVNNFKNWLSNNNVTVYYELEEPKIIQLEQQQIELFKGENNISILGEIKTNMDMEYVSGYETIDEYYLKDVNVNFGEKYGPINSIVLSRAGESDNIYLRDEESVARDGLTEVKIIDNQIMNFNNRSEFIPDILNKLDGLQYYLNDFTSTGITYFDIYDKYNVKIDDKIYNCIMFNDEVNITQGLEETVYTELPEKTETDYKKADKTDQRLNQTYIIVDKQNQVIEGVVTNVTEQNNKISRVTQTVDELNSKIKDIANITVSNESSNSEIEFTSINQSEPITLKVRPILENISYLYPHDGLYPSETLYPKNRIIRFENTKTGEITNYTLPDDLLYYDSETYDEFYLNYDSQTCQITKRCEYNSDGTVRKLDTEIINEFEYPRIQLNDGDFKVSIYGYNYGYIYATLMASNIYTSQFATKVEMESEIKQTAQEIDLNVNQKLTNYSTTTEMNSAINITAAGINQTVSKKVGKDEVISSINQTAEEIKINANKINLQGYVTVSDLSGSGTTTINGSNITTGTISADRISGGTLQGTTITGNTINGGTINGATITGTTINGNTINGGTINGTKINVGNGVFNLSDNGALTATNANITGKVTATSGSFTGAVHASSGSFSGTVNSSSGSIGGWNLSSSRLSGTYSGKQYSIRPYGVANETDGISQSWGNIMRAASDINLKHNIKEIDDKFNNFYDDLKPVTFFYNNNIVDNKKHIGFIAQDIIENQKNINENLSMVDKNEFSKYYNLYKDEIIALNTWQIQKLKKKVQKQEEIINNLIERIEKLENK